VAVVARRTPPWALAAALALLWLALAPRTPDLAAQVYRVSLWAREGFSVWDGAWYAGHHLPAYSLLYPLLGARVTGVVTAVCSALLFDRLAGRHFGPSARAGTVWFALARGWETQLDRKYDGLFYNRRLTAAGYERWLRRTGGSLGRHPGCRAGPACTRCGRGSWR
jgi:hypothetical protein